jgi:hypothetical protein
MLMVEEKQWLLLEGRVLCVAADAHWSQWILLFRRSCRVSCPLATLSPQWQELPTHRGHG